MGPRLTSSFLMLLVIPSLAEKQLWNDQTDILLDYFSIGYRAANSTDIPVMDIKNSTVSLSGLRLGDISTIKRMSDVVLETKSNGDTRISGAFGLEKFELKVTFARVNNYSGPAIITCGNNSADVTYSVRNPDKPFSCKTKWEKFVLGEFSDIRVKTPDSTETDETDYSAEFNHRILPTLNHYFNTPESLVVLSKTFDFCTYKRLMFPLR